VNGAVVLALTLFSSRADAARDPTEGMREGTPAFSAVQQRYLQAYGAKPAAKSKPNPRRKRPPRPRTKRARKPQGPPLKAPKRLRDAAASLPLAAPKPPPQTSPKTFKAPAFAVHGSGMTEPERNRLLEAFPGLSDIENRLRWLIGAAATPALFFLLAMMLAGVARPAR